MGKRTRVQIVADITSAYLANNYASNIPDLISRIDLAICLTANESSEVAIRAATAPSRQMNGHRIACLECGKGFKIMRTHLMSTHGLTPFDYCKKWKLPWDSPMVSPTYSKTRSTIALAMGLGKKGR